MSNVTEPPVSYQPPQQGGGSGMTIVVIILAVLLVVALACGGILAALLIPAIGSARQAAQRMQCSNNMKQISLALLNYESMYKSFPPAFTVDENGNKLHSWRTLILPFMEQEGLYGRIDLSKPWNDDANAFLADAEIGAFSCPSGNLAPGLTTYVAVIDPAGIFGGAEPTQFRSISDGTANTLLVVEVDNASAVPWASPQDTDTAGYLASLATPTHTGGGNVAMADGSIQFVASTIDPQLVESMVTKDGGETLAP